MGVWDFIQDQVLGMQWLNALIGMGLSALGLDVTGQIGGSIQFFIYDVLKITVLLCVLISLVDMGITPHIPTQNRTCAINAYGFSLYIFILYL